MRTFIGLALRCIVAVIAIFAFALVMNASFWSNYRAPMTVLAHRGLHQAFHREGLTNDTCTATRIQPPVHDYLENTARSMEAAFDLGADIVEFDVHPTTDGHFAVFHDWRLECRTNGMGVTREQTLPYLQGLDIGHGYTADGGTTFPFRGKGVALMPSLDGILHAFPARRFLINLKSNDPREGDLLADRLLKLPAEQRARLMAYGGDRPMTRLRERIPELRVMSRKMLVDCAVRYLALGWSGSVPQACRNTILLVPVNYGFVFWGWPNLFFERMNAANTLVFVTGPYAQGDPGTSGIDSEEDLARLPKGFSGGIWTNRIDRIAPKLKVRAAQPAAASASR